MSKAVYNFFPHISVYHIDIGSVSVKLEKHETIVMGLYTGAIASRFGKRMVGKFDDTKAGFGKYGGLNQTERIEKSDYTIPYFCLNITVPSVKKFHPNIIAFAYYK